MERAPYSCGGAPSSGAGDPADLVHRKRVYKPLSEYGSRTRTVAALERAPGRSIRYVAANDGKRSRARVPPPFEAERYDEECDADLLLLAAESILASLGWDRSDIERCRRDMRDARLSSSE